jgi:hypothetical protein
MDKEGLCPVPVTFKVERAELTQKDGNVPSFLYWGTPSQLAVMDDVGRAFSMLAVNMEQDQTSHVRSTGDRIAAGALIAVAGLVLYAVAIVIYRLWFHPLSKFPGPFLNRVSDVSTKQSNHV